MTPPVEVDEDDEPQRDVLAAPQVHAGAGVAQHQAFDGTGQVVEPMLTDQWFMAMTKPGKDGQSIAGKAMAACCTGSTSLSSSVVSWAKVVTGDPAGPVA